MSGMGTFGSVAGGLGLVLLGLWLATDGVKLAGGSVLKANLRHWAASRWRAFETGFAIALLVPSSNALTRASIGFVNSGLVAPTNALWLTVGCSFGSVITAWLVVAGGLSPSAFVLGLMLAAIGVALRATGPQERRGAWGQALAGLGVLFLGVAFLAEGFRTLGPASLEILPFTGAEKATILLVVGCALAALLRSASATVAAVLVAAATGALALDSGMLLVLGANLGAAVPAALSLRAGTPAAKRLALGHVGFHVLSTAIGLILLAALLGRELPGPLAGPAFAVAAHHLCFQVLAALLLWPLATPLTRLLSARWQDEELALGRPTKLDASLLAVPDLALAGLLHEVKEIRRLSCGLAHTALRGEPVSEFRLRHDVAEVARLVREIDVSMVQLAREEMRNEVAEILIEVPRATRALEEMCDAVSEFRHHGSGGDPGLDPRLRTRLRQLQLAVLHLIENTDPLAASFSPATAGEELRSVRTHLLDSRMRLHEGCAKRELHPQLVDRLCCRIDSLERIARLSFEVAEKLTAARRSAFRDPEPAAPDLEPTAIRAAA